jgi:hypothetical protein
MENMKEGIDFDSEREYDKYVADLAKGIEMLNLLLEANLFYQKIKNNRVNNFFRQLTTKMEDIRKSLDKIDLYIPNSQNEDQK